MNAPTRRKVLLGVPAAAALGACSRTEGHREQAKRATGARAVVAVIDAQPSIDGAGVRLRRSLGSSALPLLDPFLMLDEIHATREEDYIAGFPSHPHRGFETVTYMIEGAMVHRDSLGNQGHLGPGSVQWMTAGRGIIHSEMPRGEGGPLWGFQLWVNLPSSFKMTRPRYQDLAPERVVAMSVGTAAVRVVAGEAFGKRGPVDGIVTAPHMLEVKLPANGQLEHAVPASHNAFAYVFEGATSLGPSATRARAGQLAVFGKGDVISMQSDEGARLLFFSAEPIGEPVARRGPFVMNTEEEIVQAIEDYRNGRLVQG